MCFLNSPALMESKIMNHPKITSATSIQQAIAELGELRRTALALPAEEAMDVILSARQPAALVHSIAETDLFFMVQDIGPDDCLPLLELASNAQWDFILDMATWKGDRIEIRSLTRWLNLRFMANPDRFLRWAQNEEIEFIEWYLFRNIQIRVLETDEEPADIPDAFMTIDNMVYFRFLPESVDMVSSEDETDASDTDEERYTFITSFLEKLYSEDPIQYQNIMLEAQTILSAETEEEAWRIRNIRMAEKGFLPFDEAIGVYQPLKPDAIPKRIISKKRTGEPHLPVPSYASGMMEVDNVFVRSLIALEHDRILPDIQAELVSLINQIVVADQKLIASKADIEDVVKKAAGYLSIGLARLSAKPINVVRSASLIRSWLLSGIFRVGYGAALELKWQAQGWVKQSWFTAQKLPLSFWGESWLGVLGGLLIKKPLFFDNYQTGVLYREFRSIEDIQATQTLLNQIIRFDQILGAMADDLTLLLQSIPSRQSLSYKNLILTRWAQCHIGLSPEIAPIPMDSFILFFRELFGKPGKPDSAKSGRISKAMKSSFLLWLSEKTGWPSIELTERSGPEMERFFAELEADLGSVSEADLKPRYIQMFLVGP
jgi:Family of unknown function (DUF6178)